MSTNKGRIIIRYILSFVYTFNVHCLLNNTNNIFDSFTRYLGMSHILNVKTNDTNQLLKPKQNSNLGSSG